MDDVNKKPRIRKVLKEVVFKTFAECNTTTEEEKLKSVYETLKRKINAVKTIEDEIIDISNDEKLIEDIIVESNEFEIEAKSKLVTMEKLVRKQQPDLKNTRRNENVSMRLPKLEIPKFCGGAKKWPEFWDSYEAAIDKSNLLDVEKFNYLKTLVIGEAANAISGISLTNDNYGEAINILKDRFGNKQIIVSSHMNSLLKLSTVKRNDLQQLRSFYDEVELNVRSLVTLGVTVESFGTLVSTVVIDKLTPDIKLLIARHIKDTWNLTKILELLNEELKTRETVNMECKNVDSDEILVVGSRCTSHQSVKCCFCKGSHWSDKCHVVTDAVARKEFLRKGDWWFLCLGQDHISRNCQKSKWFYCNT